MFVVVEIKWHQYIVKAWDTIVVDNVWSEVETELVIDNVCASFDEKWEDVKVWAPYIKNASVLFKVVENKKWEKLRVLKFKRKNRYQKIQWFRPHQTVLKVDKINI